MIDNVRPIVASVHPNLISELKIRQMRFEEEIGRPTKGGLIIFSKMAAEELRFIRLSGEQLYREILGLKSIYPKEINLDGVKKLYVPFEDFKRLFIYSSVLNKKKDEKQVKLEINKIKGLKKSEITFLW